MTTSKTHHITAANGIRVNLTNAYRRLHELYEEVQYLHDEVLLAHDNDRADVCAWEEAEDEARSEFWQTNNLIERVEKFAA